jgi:ABC-2 type transport system permease protein
VTVVVIVLVGIAVAAARMALRARSRRGSAGRTPARSPLARRTGTTGIVAAREVRERVRGRVFRVGTLLILAVVAAAIVIPTLTKSTPQPQRVGVVGTLSAESRSTVAAAAKSVGTAVRFVDEPDAGVARAQLGAGTLDLAIVDGRALVVNETISSTNTSTTAQFVTAAAQALGVRNALAAAHLTPSQSAALAQAKPLPVHSLHAVPTKSKVDTTSVIGLILVFVMLTQYNTWILMGVMEEKSSRVIEVLLAAIRPIQLLSGKVLGIGLVAFGQATLIVSFALVLAAIVGSDLLRGSDPLVVVSILVWLVLGYSFYSWVYAAAGSMAERQDQVQSLALPLSLPIIFGYVVAITAATTASASPLVKVLGYLPPTAPFAMPVLVGLSAVTWWQFAASVAITIVSTVGVARLATSVYRRAILRTGRRVRLREVFARSA